MITPCNWASDRTRNGGTADSARDAQNHRPTGTLAFEPSHRQTQPDCHSRAHRNANQSPMGPILGAHEGVSFQGVTLPWPTSAALDIVCAQHLLTRTVRGGCAEPRASQAYWSGIVHTIFRGAK